MDDLDELLRASAPPVDVEASDGAMRDVALAVTGHQRLRPWRLRRRAVTIFAGVVLVPAVAAASVLHFTAETGHYGKPGFTENDTSQYINMCTSDVTQYVETLEPTGQPLPPGTTWNQIAYKYTHAPIVRSSCPPKGPGLVTQVTGIKMSLLQFSTCPWEKWALSAPVSAQAADLRRADAVLAELQVATHKVSPRMDSGYKQQRDQYADASRAFLEYDYQVNCLGRDTAANPPTVTDPDQ